MYECICTVFVPEALKSERTASDPPELVLQMVVGHHVGARD